MNLFPKAVSIQNERPESKILRRSFAQDECGGITLFVLTISMLLLVAGGMAVDFERHELARADLQNALDRGVLAATSSNHKYDLSGPLSVDEQAKQLISEYLASRNYKTSAVNISTVVTQTPGGRSITASANYPLDTIFLSMMGLSKMNVPVRSGALQGAPKLEITLVLDVSGSMSRDSTSSPGTKLAQLKVAAKEFLDTILAADTGGETLITIVPFSQQVNLPRSMADVYNLDRHHDFSSCFDYHGLDFSTTVMPTNSSVPFEQGQHFIEDNAGRRSVHYGCPRAMNAITPFSNDLSQLKNAIDGLASESWTTTYVGVKWGTALLDPSSRPVVDAMIANNELSAEFAGWPHAWSDTSVRKITVVMSDGQNTRLNEIDPSAYEKHTPDYWNVNAPGRGEKITVIDNDRTGQGDRLLKDICDQAKVGVNSTVYTIGFELGGQPKAKIALGDCSSSLSTFYLVDGVDISTAFQNIADEIVNLKLIN